MVPVHGFAGAEVWFWVVVFGTWRCTFVSPSFSLHLLCLALAFSLAGVGVVCFGFFWGRSDAGREPLKKRGEGGAKVQGVQEYLHNTDTARRTERDLEFIWQPEAEKKRSTFLAFSPSHAAKKGLVKETRTEKEQNLGEGQRNPKERKKIERGTRITRLVNCYVLVHLRAGFNWPCIFFSRSRRSHSLLLLHNIFLPLWPRLLFFFT
ncbi:hypothetical protein J3F83DRAFT_344567 [Trichoderma novae-zelandiae]